MSKHILVSYLHAHFHCFVAQHARQTFHYFGWMQLTYKKQVILKVQSNVCNSQKQFFNLFSYKPFINDNYLIWDPHETNILCKISPSFIFIDLPLPFEPTSLSSSLHEYTDNIHTCTWNLTHEMQFMYIWK
jgi:hypothetical protein